MFRILTLATILGGIFAGSPIVFAQYIGGTGDGDIMSSYEGTLNGSYEVIVSSGGVGRGDDMVEIYGTTICGGIVWRGGGVPASPTAWNEPLNWYPNNAVPGPGDLIFIEANGNGFNPVLDQHRTVRAIDFNNSGKKVILGAYNLTMTDVALGADPNNYVKTTGKGKLIRPVVKEGESFTFPIGNQYYNPLEVTNNTGAPDQFSARVEDAVYISGSGGATILTPHVRATWDISKGNGTAAQGNGVDLKFSWYTNQEYLAMPFYKLNHHDGTQWEIVASANPSEAEGIKTIVFPGYNGGFSPFAIGGNNTSPLPVILVNFDAECAEDRVEITWVTESEVNNEWFTLHRSADMIHWEEVLKLSGAGNSNQPIHYSATDDRPMEGISYYRLTQTDYDGKSESFMPTSAFCSDADAGSAIRIYPNPSDGMVNLRFADYLTQDLVALELIEPSGRVLRTTSISLLNEGKQHTMDFSELPMGAYFLHVRGKNGYYDRVKMIKNQ